MIRVICGHSSLGCSLRKNLGTGGINLILIPPHPVFPHSQNTRKQARTTGNEQILIVCIFQISVCVLVILTIFNLEKTCFQNQFNVSWQCFWSQDTN